METNHLWISGPRLVVLTMTTSVAGQLLLAGCRTLQVAPVSTQTTATPYVDARWRSPEVLGIEKDPQALRRAIDSGKVVEVTEDTWVTLTTNEWENQEEYSSDPSQGVPMLFAGTRRKVAGEVRYVAACYYELHRTICLWVTDRQWGEGVVTCDFFLQSVPEEHPEWAVAHGPSHGRTRIFSLPADVAKELFGPPDETR